MPADYKTILHRRGMNIKMTADENQCLDGFFTKDFEKTIRAGSKIELCVGNFANFAYAHDGHLNSAEQRAAEIIIMEESTHAVYAPLLKMPAVWNAVKKDLATKDIKRERDFHMIRDYALCDCFSEIPGEPGVVLAEELTKATLKHTAGVSSYEDISSRFRNPDAAHHISSEVIAEIVHVRNVISELLLQDSLRSFKKGNLRHLADVYSTELGITRPVQDKKALNEAIDAYLAKRFVNTYPVVLEYERAVHTLAQSMREAPEQFDAARDKSLSLLDKARKKEDPWLKPFEPLFKKLAAQDKAAPRV